MGLIHVVIPGRFAGLNEFIAACRKAHGKWSGGNAMKQEDQRRISVYLPRGIRFKKPIYIEYCFYEPNAKRDKDNISGYFHKIFQDALVQSGIIENDGWRQIDGMADYFKIDQKFPRVEVFMKEKK